MKKDRNVEDIFREVGEFGPYQLFLFFAISGVSLSVCFSGYGFTLYGAVPSHRLFFV
jgi:hypothetical protein